MVPAASMVFFRMDDEAFILAMKNNKITYDTTHPFYEDDTEKEKAWTKISTTIGVDVAVCKMRWNTLRDAFVKNRKKSSSPSGGTQTNWKYAEMMSFLHLHLQPRSSKSNLRQQPCAVVEEERSSTPSLQMGFKEKSPTSPLQSHQTSSVLLVQSVASTSREGGLSSRSQRRRERTLRPRGTTDSRRNQAPNDLEEQIISILQELPPKPHIPKDDLEESYHFALSLVPILNRLDRNRRQQAKISLLNTLHELETGLQSTAPSPVTAGWRPIHPQPPPLHPATDTGPYSQATQPTAFRPFYPTQQTSTATIGAFTLMSSSDEQLDEPVTGGGDFTDM